MKKYQIAVLSDTHGLLREEVIENIKNVDYIIHAGDIGSFAILNYLQEAAPLTIVRGNIDSSNYNLPISSSLNMNNIKILVIHDISQFYNDNKPGKPDVVIFGHSHKAKIEYNNGILYFNPGSAGPRRFNLPVTMGFLHIDGDKMEPEIIYLIH